MLNNKLVASLLVGAAIFAATAVQAPANAQNNWQLQQMYAQNMANQNYQQQALWQLEADTDAFHRQAAINATNGSGYGYGGYGYDGYGGRYARSIYQQHRHHR